MLPLTTKQAAFKALIKDRTRQGVPPTYAELAEAFGLSSKGGVHRMLTCLKERGHVAFEPCRHGTLRVIEALPALDGLSRAQLVMLRDQIDAALAARFAEPAR